MSSIILENQGANEKFSMLNMESSDDQYPNDSVALLQNNGRDINIGRVRMVPPSETQTTLLFPDNGDEKGLTEPISDLDEGYSIEKTVPRDRFYLVYIIMTLHGIGTLMGWNMFITAQDYFVGYKFGGKCTEYSKNFLSYLGICSQVPNLMLSLVNIFARIGGSLSKRILISIVIITIVFIFTMVLAIVDSKEMSKDAFFGITMASVVIMNAAIGVYQNSSYGLCADLPMRYTNCIVFGNNISGTITAVLYIVNIYAAPDERTSAIYYFLTAVIILLICFDTYFILPHCAFYRHYKQLANEKRQIEAAKSAKKALISQQKDSECCGNVRLYAKIMSKVWIQCFNVFFVFFVSLTIFPAMQADVMPLSHGFKNLGKYYLPVTCFLTFSLFATLGNFLANYIQFPSPKWLWLPVVLRGLMIPYFMFCNYRSEFRSFPVYITNDWAFYIVAVLMAFTSGYFSSLSMMYAPRTVKTEHAPMAGMFAAFFLIVGINAGIGFSLVIANITEKAGPIAVSYVNNSCDLQQMTVSGIPVPYGKISNSYHPKFAALSDAYVEARGKIVEYHKVLINTSYIASNNVILLEPLPSCMGLKSYAACTSIIFSGSNCVWCSAKISNFSSGFCSDSLGRHRWNPEWKLAKCDKQKRISKGSCPGQRTSPVLTTGTTTTLTTSVTKPTTTEVTTTTIIPTVDTSTSAQPMTGSMSSSLPIRIDVLNYLPT